MRKIRRFQFGGSVSGGGLKGIQQTAQGLIGTVNEFSNALINGVSGGGGFSGGYGGQHSGGFGGTNPYAAPPTSPVNPVYPNIPSMPQNSGYPGSAYVPPNMSDPGLAVDYAKPMPTMPPGFTGPGFDFINRSAAEREAQQNAIRERAAAAGLVDDFGRKMPAQGTLPSNLPGIAGLAGQAQVRSNPYARPSVLYSGPPSLRNDAIEGAYNPNIPRMGVAANTNPLTGNFSNILSGNRLNLMKAGGVVKKATTKAKPAAKPKAKAKPMAKPVAKKLSPTRGDGIAQRGKTKGRMV